MKEMNSEEKRSSDLSTTVVEEQSKQTAQTQETMHKSVALHLTSAKNKPAPDMHRTKLLQYRKFKSNLDVTVISSDEKHQSE